MSQIRRDPATRPDRRPAAAVGVYFASALLIVEGVLSILEGIAGIAKDNVYTVVGNYAYRFNLTSWGWIQLVLGVIVLAAGVGLLTGAVWARLLGILMASLSVIAHFLFIPYQPIWSIAIIAISLFVIWALCTAYTRDDL